MTILLKAILTIITSIVSVWHIIEGNFNIGGTWLVVAWLTIISIQLDEGNK